MFNGNKAVLLPGWHRCPLNNIKQTNKTSSCAPPTSHTLNFTSPCIALSPSFSLSLQLSLLYRSTTLSVSTVANLKKTTTPSPSPPSFAMDYPYFQAAPQPYQFLGLPPTPSHTNSAHSDDFSNGSPPMYDQFQQQFDQYGFNNHNVVQQVKPPSPPLQHKTSITSINPNVQQTQSQVLDANAMDLNDESNRQRGGSNSDDEENMTPAQSRRKAQNRAAQRAFRERKERHVKDLEAKLAALTSSSSNLSTENELLRQQLQRASTENEILRATSGHQRSVSPPPTAGPLRYTPKDFYTEVLEPHDNKTISHRVSKGESGERLLAAGATWDFIINSEQYKRGMVDVGDVSERLKSQARCDGQGPVFEERVIVAAIEASIASGNDELL
ncbi:bZIP transcription factor [Phlyctema vagabunda]|uniref:BZIP transcription factor n=1 Tax=Phlyctema vagabunda TaxID=108571 RepID=A0ABR4P9F3_9HELO